MTKRKRLFIIIFTLPPFLFGLLYGGGYIAQFIKNYNEWQASGGTPGDGTSPLAPSFAVGTCFEAIFTMPYGIFGILICVGVLALLIVMVMRMGYGDTGEYDKDRNFIYSKKGTYGTSGFMDEKEAEEIFDITSNIKNHNGTIFGMMDGKYICMPHDSMLNKNVAVYGASGSMKTRAYCINRILQATVPGSDGNRESLIICDPKSELYEKTSELLRKTHTVKVFNLVCPENSDSWNCLAEIEGDELMAQRFCDVIIKNTGSERGDHFWDSAEMNLLKALVAIVDYRGFRVVIPLKEMLVKLEHNLKGSEYSEMIRRQNKLLSNMLGCEIDFIVKGVESKTRTVVASRKEAMLRKRQTFYMNTDSAGNFRIFEGRKVQARVIAVAEKAIRIEAFGVECSIMARDLSWDWIGDANERFFVGDQILVRILEVKRDNIEDISIKADVKSVSENTNRTYLKQCRVQSKYAGKVTDVHKGVVYVRLTNGANAIAHTCLDRRTPGKKDDVSFAVTHIDEERGVAVGIITRIIKQNL